MPATPIDDELLGARLLYSSGTTGRPKPFRQKLLGVHPADAPARHPQLMQRLSFSEDTVFLSPAPNYHAAPFTFSMNTQALGGTVVSMQRFDAAGALAAIARYGVTHSQWVPTMLVRMLRLPQDERTAHDLSSHRVAVTSGAPCPPEVKTAIMEWWGPILHEYYGASEGYGHTYISPEDALTHPGSVGKPLSGTIHITDESGEEVPPGTVGKVWFGTEGATAPVYTNESEGGHAVHPRGWRSVGDLGYLDPDGFLYLTGREGFTIVSGGVNIYPQEVEDALLSHPAVLDAAVLGVPDPDLGEAVKAIVQLVDGQVGSDELAETLREHCRSRIARFKCPKSIEFAEVLPRLDSGKLDKRALRARYWPAPAQTV